ncbi:hypothetical protein BJF93_16165 [Xaviernesmea oryzae]|uniref:Uncharacterized protein n=1 Tax=Xaviernesmea oryzae TaxID=464029 RepID=A0A1Q9ASK8_9HYPH|nr:hypothetical protein [Xaviernesmea oryzae]OLP58417.1 hypothetical protein BJF93_16165 [Xaviernesmea oryzae]SEM33997.1 hypothetical protein SAMN04487976_13019 [Xaviernesmea oryzae]
MIFKRRSRLAAVFSRGTARAVPYLLLALPTASLAEDRGRLIWSPEKTAERAFKLRVGVRLGEGGQASAGTDLAVSASRSGRIITDEPPVAVWGVISGRSGSGDARRASVRVEARDGVGHADLTRSRTMIVSERVDLKLERVLSFDCNVYAGQCQAPLLDQTARLSAVGLGTAVIARSRLDAQRFDASQALGLEQKLGKLRLGAEVVDLQDSPHANFSANMAFHW